MCWYFQFNPYSYNFFLNPFINILLFLILLQVDSSLFSLFCFLIILVLIY